MGYIVGMSDIIFDTLKYAKRLKEAGFTEQQAETQAEVMHEVIDDKLATKQDLKRLEERLSYRLTIRFGGMLVAAVLVLAAIIKF